MIKFMLEIFFIKYLDLINKFYNENVKNLLENS